MQPDIVRYTERREARATGLAATFCGTDATATNTLLFATAPTFALGTVNRGIAGAGFIQNANAPGVAMSAGSWFNWTNSATLGTLISLLERGVYEISLGGVQTAAAALIWAVSLNGNFTAAAAGQLITVAGVEQSTGLVTTVAADTAPINLKALIYVSETQAGTERLAVAANTVAAQTSLTNHATVRLHCSQAAGGLPLDAEILQTQVYCNIRWIADFRGA